MRSRIEAYAIVSHDDAFADADGLMPETLTFEADFIAFQAALDQADLCVMGRISHEAHPNVKQRKRLILSSSAKGLEQRLDGWWWNPETTPWSTVLPIIAKSTAEPRLAIVGGQRVYDLFLPLCDAFHLTRAAQVSLPEGRKLFKACEAGTSAKDVLRDHGFAPQHSHVLNEKAALTLHVWDKIAI
jgi:dihydrofolate reductase